MSVEIEVGANLPEDDRVVLTEEEIIRCNPVTTHTGKGDMTATVKGNRNLEKFAQRQDRINVNINGSTKWTGYLTDVSHNKGSGTTRIRADGIGKRLEETRPDYDSIGGPVTYSNIALHDALRDYWGRTPFSNYSVTDQSTETVAQDSEIQNVDSSTEWDNATTIGADIPLYVDNGQLKLAQTCWVAEAEDNNNGGGVSISDSNFSGGSGFDIDRDSGAVEFTFSPQYDIPASNVGIASREGAYSFDSSVDIRYEVGGDGTTFSTSSSSSLGWFNGDDIASPTISAGDTVTARVQLQSSPSGDNLPVDIIAVYDSRYTYNFDNDNGGSGGYLDGPELYPTSITTTTDTVKTSYNITAASVTSTWNDTSGPQSIGVSNDGGSTFLRSSNTDTVDKSFSDPGRLAQIEYTLGRYGSRTTATPQQGYLGQAIDDHSHKVDGNNLVVVDSLELSRNHWDNLQTLHGYGDFLWVIEHDSSDISNLVVSSFQRGDETRPKPSGFDNPKNQQPEIQAETYYNSIYLEGALQDDGTRPTAEIKDEDAISNDGREISPGVLRDLTITTDAGASFRARSLLDTAQSNNDLVGSITVPPTITDPGYARPVDLGDGEKEKTVEEVSLSLGTNSAEATFEFSVRPGFAEDISSLRREAKEVGDKV